MITQRLRFCLYTVYDPFPGMSTIFFNFFSLSFIDIRQF